MDDLVASKAMPEWLSSNHYQFLLLQGIGMLGAFNFSKLHLSRRRSDCRPCNHLLTAYPELWNWWNRTWNWSIDARKWTIHSFIQGKGIWKRMGRMQKDMPYWKMPIALLSFDWPNRWKWFDSSWNCSAPAKKDTSKSSGRAINVGNDWWWIQRLFFEWMSSPLANMRK